MVKATIAGDVVDELTEVVADNAGDFVSVRQDLVERTVLGDPLDCGLLPHLGHAGQVVTRFADQRSNLRVLIGANAVAFHDLLCVVPGKFTHTLLRRIEQRDIIVHELNGVAIP